jgi:hypothetical protein
VYHLLGFARRSCAARSVAARAAVAGPTLLVALLLGAAPALRAQVVDVPVESVFTAKLTTESIFPVAGKEPRFTAIKVTTKDLLAEFADRLALDPLPRRSRLVIRRATALEGATLPDFTLGSAVFIADAQAFVVLPAMHPSLFVDLPVAAIGGSTAQKTVLRDGVLRGRTRVRVRGLTSGDLDENAFLFNAVAVETAVEKLAKLPRGAGEALLFSKRTLVLTGSAQFAALPDLPVGFPLAGAISGTLTLSGEKRVP